MSVRPPYVPYVKDIVWRENQNYTYTEYKAALDSVFDSLFFESAHTRFILIGSYRMNLRNMVLYALDNNIDEIEYIKSIRNILLKDRGCHSLTK